MVYVKGVLMEKVHCNKSIQESKYLSTYFRVKGLQPIRKNETFHQDSTVQGSSKGCVAGRSYRDESKNSFE